MVRAAADAERASVPEHRRGESAPHASNSVRLVGFHQQLERSWTSAGSMLCVGLDPDPARYPAGIDGAPDATERFCREIIDATAHVACAFKPQIAYFASQAAEPV